MGKKQGILFFSLLIAYLIVWTIFSEMLSSTLNSLLRGIWIISLIYYIWWLFKKKDYYKKQDSLKSTAEYRLGVLEEMGIYTAIIPLMYFMSLIVVGLGIFILFSDRPDKLEFSISMLAIGFLGILGTFFLKKSRKKNLR